MGMSRPRINWTLSSLRDREQALTILSQLIPTVRLIAPVAAGLLGTSTLRFVAGVAVGISLVERLVHRRRLSRCFGHSGYQSHPRSH